MIVNPSPAGWQVVYQQAHALLASQLAYAWPATTLPPARWVGLLAAIAQHDDEQEAWRGRGGHHGLTPVGAPANFTQKEFSLGQVRELLAAARFQGQWRSLLTSLHLSCLYEELRGSKQETTNFLDELKRQQAAWTKALGISKAEARQAYDLLHWADRLSLILCRQELPEMGRELEIYHHPLGKGSHYVSQPAGPGTAVVVRPWPFAAPEFEASVEVSNLNRLAFADDADLAQALREAPVETVRWTLKRG